MKKERRSFSPEDRLTIVQEGQREGTTATGRKYNFITIFIAKWRSKYLAKGVEGLKPAYTRVDPAVRALEEDNERLKRIISRQALGFKLNQRFYKNSHPSQTKKMIVKQY